MSQKSFLFHGSKTPLENQQIQSTRQSGSSSAKLRVTYSSLGQTPLFKILDDYWLEVQLTEKKRAQMEENEICKYLQLLGLQILTDPLLKEHQYYQHLHAPIELQLSQNKLYQRKNVCLY